VRRTQLYLQDDIWKALHIHARQRGASISELVRRAVREKYGSSPARRREAMQALVGLWSGRNDIRDSRKYVRRLRRGKRLKRLAR